MLGFLSNRRIMPLLIAGSLAGGGVVAAAVPAMTAVAPVAVVASAGHVSPDFTYQG